MFRASAALWAAVLVAVTVTVAVAQQAPAGQAAAETPATPATPATPPVPGTELDAPAQHDTAKGAEVLAAARQALGGAERIAAVERLEMKGKSARAVGSSILEGDFTFQFERPDKFRRQEQLTIGSSGGIHVAQVLNGDQVTEETAFASSDFNDFDRGGRGGRGRGGQPNLSGLLGGPPVDPNADPESQQEARRTAAASELARLLMAVLLTTSEPVAWLGTAASPGGTADVLEFPAPDGEPTRVLIDTKTRMPLLLSWTGIPTDLALMSNRGRGRGNSRGSTTTPQTPSGPTTLQMYLSDYKTVGGIRLPHLIQRGANNETTEEFVVTDFRINPLFGAEHFTN